MFRHIVSTLYTESWGTFNDFLKVWASASSLSCGMAGHNNIKYGLNIKVILCFTYKLLGAVCYEKGYVNVGEQLNLFQDIEGNSVNYQSRISSVQDCIDLCKQHRQCRWWNYNPDVSTCWLKSGQGNPKKESKYSEMFTGHRDSTDQCQDRLMFTPAVFSPTNRGNVQPANNNNNGWFGGLFPSNPCPNGRINTNCYDDGISCIRCCTGDVAGNDGTPACLH